MTLIIALLALQTVAGAAAQGPAISGTVLDPSGAAIPGAIVIVHPAGNVEVRTVSGPEGRFTVAVTTDEAVELTVRATGFTELRQQIPAGPGRSALRIELVPASLAEVVTVTPTRTAQRVRDVPASINVIDRETIRRSPAVVADDVLRLNPTFSLFRRTSSLSSHPTAQGVSLRGIGPSGVSRTLVLVDGVPFNDPFGGWVYWTRVPLAAAQRIETVDGATSSLYGNYAMGGVINIVTTPATRRTVEFTTQYGNRNSPKLDVRASDVFGRLGVSLDVSSFDTDGYPVVAESERGLVDTKAAVMFRNANLRLQYDFSERTQAFLQAGYFREERDNAKITTINPAPEANDTTWKTVSAGVRSRLDDGSELSMRVFGDSEVFHSNFMAVPAATPARSIGRMTLNQTVPTSGIGAMAQWSRALGARHSVSAGLDWRGVTGESQEDGLDAVTGSTVTLRRESGGRQRSTGVFAQDIITVTPALSLTLSGRVDHWRNDEGHNIEISMPSGTPTAGHAPTLPVRTDTVGSPRVAALYQVNDRVSVWGSVGAGFRAPTLNELYRQFRVGAVLTLANNELGPERLVGGEAGLRFEPSRNVNARITWFDNRVKDPVSNVTLVPGGTTQQRQNLGATKIQGIQAEAEYRPSPSWRVMAGYLFSQAKVTEFDANPDLIGNYLAQVPRHRGSVSVAFSDPRWFNFAVDVQAVGSQFDDDQNTRTVPGYSSPGLPKYGLVSISASRRVARELEIFVGAQNLLDQQYYVGTLPTTIGSPRLINAGIRVMLGGR